MVSIHNVIGLTAVAYQILWIFGQGAVKIFAVKQGGAGFIGSHCNANASKGNRRHLIREAFRKRWLTFTGRKEPPIVISLISSSYSSLTTDPVVIERDSPSAFSATRQYTLK